MKKNTETVLALISGAGIGALMTRKLLNKSANGQDKKLDKFKSYYNMLNQWLVLKQEGKSLTEYFVNNNINTIAIYGMGEMGNRLYDELKNSGIKVKYAIDKNAESTYSELDIRTLKDELPFVDAIIVTAVFAFDDIEKEISSNVEYKVISLEDVVYEI